MHKKKQGFICGSGLLYPADVIESCDKVDI